MLNSGRNSPVGSYVVPYSIQRMDLEEGVFVYDPSEPLNIATLARNPRRTYLEYALRTSPSRFTVPLYRANNPDERVRAGLVITRIGDMIKHAFYFGTESLFTNYSNKIPTYNYLILGLSDAIHSPEILYDLIQRGEIDIVRAPGQSRAEFRDVSMGLRQSSNNFVFDENDRSIIRLAEIQNGSLIYYVSLNANLNGRFLELLDYRLVGQYPNAVPVRLTPPTLPALSESPFNLAEFEQELINHNIFSADAARNYLQERGIILLDGEQRFSANFYHIPVGRISFVDSRPVVSNALIFLERDPDIITFLVPDQGARDQEPSAHVVYSPRSNEEGQIPIRHFELASDEAKLEIIVSDIKVSITRSENDRGASTSFIVTESIVPGFERAGYRVIDPNRQVSALGRIVSITVDYGYRHQSLVARFVSPDDIRPGGIYVEMPIAGTGAHPIYENLSLSPYRGIPLASVSKEDALIGALYITMLNARMNRIIESRIVNRITELLDGNELRNPVLQNRARYADVLTELRNSVRENLNSRNVEPEFIIDHAVDRVLHEESRRVFRSRIFRELRRDDVREIRSRLEESIRSRQASRGI